jgi:ankyrin repeat protein
VDEHGQALPCAAVDARNINIIALLVAAKSDVNRHDVVGETSLFKASRRSWILAMQQLLEAKADVHSVNSEGYTPLIVAAAEGTACAVSVLLEAGANVNAVNHSGRSALFKAAVCGDEPHTRLLLEAKADVRAVDKDGRTPLAGAIQAGKSKIIVQLVDAKSEVDRPDAQGFTPLCLASLHSKASVVQQLLAAKAVANFAAPRAIRPCASLPARTVRQKYRSCCRQKWTRMHQTATEPLHCHMQQDGATKQSCACCWKRKPTRPRSNTKAVWRLGMTLCNKATRQ